jgi:release factor glutamine methyltransferase
MGESLLKVRNAFGKTLQRITSLYPEPEGTRIVELVFMNVLACSRIELFQRFETNLSNSQQIRLEEIAIQLEKFKPLQYVLGETEFYGLKFIVGPGVLIPRPETEELVDWIVNDSRKYSSLRILDIGTGSGCIAVSLAKNLSNAVIDAIDVSEEALKYARQNAKLNNCTIEFLNRDIFSIKDLAPENYDIIASNPPYVPVSTIPAIQPNVLRHEPHIALFVPDADPLLFYGKILDIALFSGKPGSRVYFEIYEEFGSVIQDLFKIKGFKEFSIRKDIQGKDRMATARIPIKK